MNNPLLLQISMAQDTLSAVSGTPDAPIEKMLTLWELSKTGGYIMLVLAILSVIALYIFIERFLTIRKASREDFNFMNNIRDFIHEGKRDAALSLCKSKDSPIARMIEKGVARMGKPLRDIGTAIETVGKLEIYKLEKNLATIATIAGVAPMLGFLGTVLGMIKTFHQMYISGNNVELSQLSGGITQALVTTVGGLIVGIIAYFAYKILVENVEKLVYKMEARTMEFLDLLEEPVKH